MAFDVFISYPHQDKAVADAACARLEAEGLRCWIAPRDISFSAEWAAAIIEAIDKCRVMVLVFSAYANNSKQIPREVQRALDGGKTVIPFRIEDVMPEGALAYYIPSIHWLDALSPPLEKHLEDLVTKVKGLLSEPMEARTTLGSLHAKSSYTGLRPRMRTWAVGGGLVLAALFAVILALWITPSEWPFLAKSAASTPKQKILLSILRASYSDPILPNASNDYSERMHKPIDLAVLQTATRENYPRELLFWLFAQSFQFGGKGGYLVNFEFNPPGDYGCQRTAKADLCYREWIWIALLSGLQVEEKKIAPTGSGSGTVPLTVARFCFSPPLARQAMGEIGQETAAMVLQRYFPFMPASVKPICGTWSDAVAQQQAKGTQGDLYQFALGESILCIVPRSPYGILQFLGNLLRVQRDNLKPPVNAYIPPSDNRLPPVVKIPPVLLTMSNEPLVTVVPKGKTSCYAEARYKGVDYCVPDGASATKHIFDFLILLNAVPDDSRT